MKPPEDFIKLLKEAPSRNFNNKENYLLQTDFSSSMGTSTPNRNKKLNFFPNLARINETGANVFTNQQNKQKFSISDLPNPNVLMIGDKGSLNNRFDIYKYFF